MSNMSDGQLFIYEIEFISDLQVEELETIASPWAQVPWLGLNMLYG